MRTIRNFQLIEQIGTGGMGVIWRAVQISLDRPVAVKELHPHIAKDKEFIVRFEREAKSAATLEHENIVGVIDFGQEGDGWFIAMELVEGPDLKSLLERHPKVPLPVAISIALDVLRGLDAAHARGIVHRDVKPANVLLTKEGIAKVADFSVAQSSNTPSVTATGAMLGTPSYMSPEQASGSSVLDRRSDVFAAGTIVYEMVTGRRAFEGHTYPAILNAVQRADPARIEAVEPSVPKSIAAVVRRAMERNVERRYETAADFARDLEHAASEENVPFSRRLVADWLRDPQALGEAIRRKEAQERLRRAQWLASKAQERLEEALSAYAAAVSLDPSNEEARREHDRLATQVRKSGGATLRLPDDHLRPTGESAAAPAREPEPRRQEARRQETPARAGDSSAFGVQPATFKLLVWGGWMVAAMSIAGLLLVGARFTGAKSIESRALAMKEAESAENALAWIEKQIDRRPLLEPKLRETRAVLETEVMLRERGGRRIHDVAWELTHKYRYARVPFVSAEIIRQNHISGSTLGLYKEALERDPRLAAEPAVADACFETLSSYVPGGEYRGLAEEILKRWYPERRKAFAEAHIEGRGAALLNAAAILDEAGDPRARSEWLRALSAYAREQEMDANEAILREVQGRDAQILSALRAALDGGRVQQANRPRVHALALFFADRVAPVTGPAGWVTVRGWPPGKVLVDGTEVAPATPLLDWRLPAGKHTIRVVGEGYDVTCDLTVRDGSSHSAYVRVPRSIDCN